MPCRRSTGRLLRRLDTLYYLHVLLIPRRMADPYRLGVLGQPQSILEKYTTLRLIRRLYDSLGFRRSNANCPSYEQSSMCAIVDVTPAEKDIL